MEQNKTTHSSFVHIEDYLENLSLYSSNWLIKYIYVKYTSINSTWSVLIVTPLWNYKEARSYRNMKELEEKWNTQRLFILCLIEFYIRPYLYERRRCFYNAPRNSNSHSAFLNDDRLWSRWIELLASTLLFPLLFISLWIIIATTISPLYLLKIIAYSFVYFVGSVWWCYYFHFFLIVTSVWTSLS